MTNIQPTTNRITSLDALRGFALLGILIMNIISHGLPSSHYTNPMAGGMLTGADYWAFTFSQLFANQKFMSLFSILFGAGIVLLTEKIEKTGRSAAARHYVRNFWLLLFGLFHAYVIWYGDILVQYATCSIWLFLFRKKSPKTLLIWAGIFFLITIGMNLSAGLSMPYWPEEQVAELCQDWKPAAEKMNAEIVAYQGSWSDHFPYRRDMAFALETFIFLMGYGWQITALMLIGMALFKSKVLTAERSSSFYGKMAGIGLSIGLGLGAVGLYQNGIHDYACDYSFFIGSQFNLIGSLPMALGYIGLFMWWYNGSGKGFLSKWLAPVGRMALTNYLMQSIIATFIFYGHGLGLFGTVGRANQWWIILGIWIFQIFFSRWWMQHFRFGPFEWLWRSLTYWRLQPFRK